jgi:hypothetical protein
MCVYYTIVYSTTRLLVVLFFAVVSVTSILIYYEALARHELGTSAAAAVIMLSVADLPHLSSLIPLGQNGKPHCQSKAHDGHYHSSFMGLWKV